MIAPQKVNMIGVSNFKLQKKSDHFYWKFSSINIISQKQISGWRRVSKHLKYAK